MHWVIRCNSVGAIPPSGIGKLRCFDLSHSLTRTIDVWLTTATGNKPIRPAVIPVPISVSQERGHVDDCHYVKDRNLYLVASNALKDLKALLTTASRRSGRMGP